MEATTSKELSGRAFCSAVDIASFAEVLPSTTCKRTASLLEPGSPRVVPRLLIRLAASQGMPGSPRNSPRLLIKHAASLEVVSCGFVVDVSLL